MNLEKICFKFNFTNINKENIRHGPKVEGRWIPSTSYQERKTFERNSSVETCHPEFQIIQIHQEQILLHFLLGNMEPLTQPFTMVEILKALNCSNDTAVGLDKIHYQFLKHLSQSTLMPF